MDTVLELQRSHHEERERLVDAMSKEMCFKPSTHKEGINSEFRLRTMYDRYVELTRSLKELYEDKDGLRKQDIQALSGPNEFGEFYSRLKMIRDFHKSHPDEISVPMSVEYERYNELRENPEEAAMTLIEFTDEEGYGRFLDMHLLYEMFINIKGIPKVDYITYLQSFDKPYDISREKKTGSYKQYLEWLITYLEGYITRTKPMCNLAEETKKAIDRFEQQWPQGIFPGWGKEATPTLTHTGLAHLDLTAFTKWEELASLGLDRLKSALLALGLKCGGTLEERARRLWVTKGKSLQDLPAHMFVSASSSHKSSQRPATASSNNQKTDSQGLTDRQRELGLLEACVYQLAELVSDQRNATVENVQRRQARTLAERDEEEDSDEDNEIAGGNKDGEGGGDGEDDDDDIPYNPKNLPVGWDGKPIPYWLYKLHGLNMYYSCEICGNQTYRGPKAFQRHFSEWRHAHGMRCLGIPNTAHFAHVTRIEDALALWQRIRSTKEQERWKAEVEEEMEDGLGNVVSRKTYDDLKRQGLL